MRVFSYGIIPILLIFLFAESVFSQVTIEAPAEVSAGAEFKVKWTGPDNKQDFISIAEVDSEDREYSTYKFTKKGELLTFQAPDEPGDYEIRYIDAASYGILGSVPLKVLETSATVEAPEEVDAGSEFRVYWTGPENKRDFITVVEYEKEERKYGKYKYVKSSEKDRDGKSYITITAPDEAGDYEVRYLSGQKYYTLGRTPITVTATAATLAAPRDAIAGSKINIYWTGPANKRDFITIVDEDAEEKEIREICLYRKEQERQGRKGNI